MKTCLKVTGTPVKTSLIFGSREYVKSDLLQLLSRDRLYKRGVCDVRDRLYKRGVCDVRDRLYKRGVCDVKEACLMQMRPLRCKRCKRVCLACHMTLSRMVSDVQKVIN